MNAPIYRQEYSLWSRYECGPWEFEASGTKARMEALETNMRAAETPRELLICLPDEGPILLKGQKGCGA